MIEMVINGIGDNQSPLISFIFTYRNKRLAKHFFNKNIYIYILLQMLLRLLDQASHNLQ